MNIFAYDTDARLCALWLDDLRKNKMILETAQLLSFAIRMNDPYYTGATYKMTHTGHPCSRWTSLSFHNAQWLYTYWLHLCKQWGKPHKTHIDLASSFQDFFHDENKIGLFPLDKRTQFPNCARNKTVGLDFTSLPVHEAYRAYHRARWNTEYPTWNKGSKPDWYEDVSS